MKTYLIPTAEREMHSITKEEFPEEFKFMERASMEMIPITEIAHLTFYDTFHVMDTSKKCNPLDMLKAGAFLVKWLIIQDKRFQSETNKETK